MKYDNSELWSRVTAPDRQPYHLYFYGENEGAAVIVGPVPSGGICMVPEVHRASAASAADARAKMRDWLRASGLAA